MQKKKNLSYWIGLITAFLFVFALPRVVHPWAASVTPMGVTVAMIFLGTIIALLTTNDSILSALIAMCALVFNGVFAPNALISAVLGNYMVWQLMTLYVLSYVIIRDGTGETLARFLLTRKWLQGKPLLVVVVLMVTMAIASIFLGVFGALILCFLLLKSICSAIDLSPNSDFARCLYLGCFITINTGANLMGKMNALHWANAQFFMDGLGIDIPSYSFSLYSLFIIIAFIIVYILAVKFLFKCDMSKFTNVDLVALLGTENTRLTKKQAIPLVCFLALACYTFFGGLLPDGIPLISEFKGMGYIIFGTLILVVLALIHVDGVPILDLNEGFSKGISWPICLVVGTLVVIGGQLLDDGCGIKVWLVETLGQALTTSSPLLILAVAIILTTFLTNIFSNTATMYIMSALIASLCVPLVGAGYELVVLPVAISTSAQMAYMTVAASGQAVLLFNQENISKKFVWTKGTITLLLWCVTCFVVCTALIYIF